MTTYRVHVLVKDERDYEDDVIVEAINSIEASKQALQKLADEGKTAHTISVWRHRHEGM